MSEKIKIYCDTGANIKFLKKYYYICDFYQYPYDSSDRPKKKRIILAEPSMQLWKDNHATWEESDHTWGDCIGSNCFDDIERTIGKENRRDVLHLDSALKSGCDIFLTSDRGDISSNKLELESICRFKIFCTAAIEEQGQIVKYIQQLREIKKL